mmetsp:Transcript_8305/g.30658  ORF Transcript_8305/g.30658 Transcript_8305/m.30658 type:complete len:96 (-) Transcript_8305:1172-1459(-)
MSSAVILLSTLILLLIVLNTLSCLHADERRRMQRNSASAKCDAVKSDWHTTKKMRVRIAETRGKQVRKDRERQRRHRELELDEEFRSMLHVHASM